MPKVLQINSNVNSGGAGRIVEQIGNQSKQQGWESYIAYGRLSNKSNSNLIKIGNKADVIKHGIKSLLLDRHGFGSTKSTKLFLKEIDKIDPDIIHLHGIHGYYINIEILFSYLKTLNKPIVWTMHDCWAITGHCSFFSDIDCLKWQKGCYKCPKYKNYPTSLIIDNSKNNYESKRKIFTSIDNVTIVSVSQWLNNIMKSSFLSKYINISILNGVDINSFLPVDETLNKTREKYNIGSKFMLLGVATSWGVRKGWFDYIKLNEVLGEEFLIVLVGLTTKQKKMLPPGIMGIERTESIEELAAFYSTADIIMNLSYQESFGLTTIEGMACGTPGIVYNATASPELITIETGEIVEPGNINEIVVAIEKIKKRGKNFYSENCRKRALEKFNQEDKAKDYLNLYNSLHQNTSYK